MPNLRLHALLTLTLAAAATPSVAQDSHISLDGSLPHGRTDVLTGPGTGPEYVISEDLGWRSGSNLFQSFLRFDVASGDTARFTSDTSLPPLANVIARVTGGDASDIDGTLRTSDIPTADFYLLNPAGVFFGGASEIDVPKSLYVSTAHELSFANGEALDLLNPSAPTLSVASVEAFGFKAETPSADIVFSNPGGPATLKQFAVGPGTTFSAVGGNVTVDNRMRLLARGGRVQLVATGSAGIEVPVDAGGLEPGDEGSEPLGDVVIRNGSEVLASSSDRNAPQGTIVIRAGRFALESESLVRAGGLPEDGGPSVDVVASRVEVSGESLLQANAPGPNPSGGLQIVADELRVSGGALVQTRTDSTANAGELRIEAGSVSIRDGALLSSFNRGGAEGGRIAVEAETLELESRSEIQSINSSVGRGGDIQIGVGQLSVTDSVISAESGSFGPGGDIAIEAQQMTVHGPDAQISTLNQIAAAPEPVIPGGEIRIGSEARPLESLRIAGGAVISTQAAAELPSGVRVGAQPGGDIHIFADSLEVTGGGSDASGASRASALQTATLSEVASGTGGSIVLELGTLRVGASEPGGVPGIVAAFVAEGAQGAGGGIELRADSALIEDGGQLSTTTQGAGDAGSIDVELSGDLVARGARNDGGLKPSGLFARGEQGSGGHAGDIDVAARRIEILDAAEISSRAEGLGDSGDIGLYATDAIRVVGGFQASSVTARGTNGRAGNVTLAGPEQAGAPGPVGLVELLDGGIVDVSLNGAGEGGLLRVVADELRVAGRSGTGIPSSLGAETAGDGNAPGIEIDVGGLVRVEQGGELNAISRGTGNAGSIDIAAAAIEFIGGRGTAATEASAAAGSLRLTASRSIRVQAGSELTVRSAQGQDAGTLTLVAPQIQIQDSTLTADADAFGGNIAIETDRLVLERASVIALSRGEGALASALAPAGGLPAGGNIAIAGGAVVLNGSRLVADGFGNANGGFIDISADPWLRSGDSVVSASSEVGLDGFVLINTPYGEVTGDLAALPESFLDASSLLEEPCLARDAPSGSFAVQQLRRAPPPPDAPLSAEPGEPLQCETP